MPARPTSTSAAGSTPRRDPPQGRPVTVPDRAAVQIASEAVHQINPMWHHVAIGERVVAALDAAGWLRRPDEAEYVAALEAVAEAARIVRGWSVRKPGSSITTVDNGSMDALLAA